MPTPPSNIIPRRLPHRWQDFRVRYIPLGVYLLGIGLSVWMWNTHWMPGTFSGEVQGATADVASLQAGQLVRLTVSQFDRVKKGQILGSVSLPRASAETALKAIRTDLMVMRARMSADGQRNQLSYQRTRMDQLDQSVDLAIARSRLRYAESEVQRQTKLLEKRIVSVLEYEQALDLRDALAEEVKEREALVAETDRALKTILAGGSMGDSDAGSFDTIEAAIQAQEDLFLNEIEAVLTAPIDGVVSKVYRSEGEIVSVGEPLVLISADHPETILGFLRQPASVEPMVGDTVVVRSRRGNQRVAAEATVLAVGGRLEMFTRPLRVRGFDSSQERGLPVLIELPEELSLYPGELVDLSFKN